MISYPLYPARKVLCLDGIWDFRFTADKQLEELVDSDFYYDDLMCVPGSFDCSPAYYCKRGTALYRTCFTLDEYLPNALLKIHGIGLRARFRIDGREVGFTNLPYSGVEFETGALASGRHELTAAVDNRFDADKMKLFLPYYDFYAFGGFYRSVFLHPLSGDHYIDRVQVRTSDYRKGKVKLRFLFKGQTPRQIQYRFDTETEFRNAASANELETAVPDFKLWSPDSPHIHTVEVKTESDRIVESFGIREIKIGNKTLLLNGEPVYLKGFNRHESHPEFGSASPEQLMVEDVQNLKKLNCNFVRGCHYPQDQRFLDICDRTGLLVWEESLGWNNTPEQMADPEFIELQKEQTRLMVRNSINHPSLILWGFLNEFQSQTEAGRNLCAELVKTIKKEDESRPVTFACNHTADDICHDLVDIISYNTYPGWIAENYDQNHLEAIAVDRDRIIKYFRDRIPPDKPILVSEMGCCAIYGQRDPAAAQWTEEFQAEYLEQVIRDVFAEDEICGLAIWQFNDAKSYLRTGSNIRCKPMAMNLAGVFDPYRRTKFSAATVARLFKDKNSK